MAVFGARAIILNLRRSAGKAGVFTKTAFRPHSRARLHGEGPLFTRVPKVTLLFWSAVGVDSCAATRQETGLSPLISDRKSVAKVRVHRLVFLLRLSLRALVLLLKFGPLLLLSPLTVVSSRFASRWLDALLWVTETSGPTFIKLGQWASTRRDVFSQDFCDRFSRLHVRVRSHSWTHTKQCLSRAFGDSWRSWFVFEGKEPVGSGCVAQVYRGWVRVDSVDDLAFQTLVEEMEREDPMEAWEIPGLGGIASSLWGIWKSKGEEETHERSHSERQHENHAEKEHLIPVAIKVLHPGIRRQVEIDLLLMRAGSWFLHCLPGLKWLSLPEIVEEFEKLMTKQIDLRFEARNIERFRENFKDVDFVKFPTPLRPFITRTILVETFEESEPISHYLSSEVPEEVKRRIARMGVETLLKMVFVDNFVHGDLHPGNILVQCRGVRDSSGGSSGTFGGPQGKATLTDLWDTVVVSIRPDPAPLQLVLLDAGIVAQLSDRDLANFKAVFTAVVQRQIQVADLLSRVFGLLITHKVKLESNFASIVFAIMVLEGLGRSLDPDLDILELAKPLLLKNCASVL
ncbi:uncharacterized aarF domain-containing protein kinase 2 isoform X2 [Lampris incognitus]|uniref:uncharacterized aarF domain-containing protein kinase 2 isoform X2 n=1 Tax=Lampris incognitus TaxID=2546036 RepID=UPI0024B4EE18|nr:uncharacterized aarF domain-containing protein kinase 2 isoform X2 [Lampris incognitus]